MSLFLSVVLNNYLCVYKTIQIKVYNDKQRGIYKKA